MLCVFSVGYLSGYPLQTHGYLDSLLGSSVFCVYTICHSFWILGWVPAPLCCKELTFVGAVEREQGWKLEWSR